MADTLNIVLKADGSGLTGTIRSASGEVRSFGTTLDATSGKLTGMGASSRKATADIASTGQSTANTDAKMKDWGRTLVSVRGTLATLGISALVSETIAAGLAMDRYQRTLAASTGSQQAAGADMAFLREQAERLGIYLPTMIQGFAMLSASTRGTSLAGRETREVFLAVAEAGRAMNLSNEDLEGIFVALSQMAGKGVVSMEELRQQLGDRLPGAMQIAARAMNMTVAAFIKMVSQGNILTSDFFPKFATALREASAAGVQLSKDSPSAEFARLKTAIFEATAAIAQGGPLQSLAKDAGMLAGALKSLTADGSLNTLVSMLGEVAVISIAAFGANQLRNLRDYAGAKLAVVVAARAEAQAELQAAAGRAANVTATLRAAQAEREEAAAALQVANAQATVATREATAASAAGAQSFALRVQRDAMENLATATNQRNVALGRFATVGAQVSSLEKEGATAATALEAAQGRAAATAFTLGNAARVAGAGLASAGSFMLDLVGGPIGVLVIALTLAYQLWEKNKEEAAEFARVTGKAFNDARQALDDFNRSPSIEGVQTLQSVNEEMTAINASVVTARNNFDNATNAYARSMARFGTASTAAVDQAGKALQDLQAKQLTLLAASDAATAALMMQFKQLTGLSTITPSVREEFATLAQQWRDGAITSDDLAQALSKIAIQGGNVKIGMLLAKEGFSGAMAAASQFADVLKGMDGDINSALVNLTRLQKGNFAAYQVKIGQEINAKGGADALTPAERAKVNADLATYKNIVDQTTAAEAANTAAKKAATMGTREAAKAQRDAIADAKDAKKVLTDLNQLIVDQALAYQGLEAKALDDHNRKIAQVDELEQKLRDDRALDPAAIAKVALARQTADDAYLLDLANIAKAKDAQRKKDAEPFQAAQQTSADELTILSAAVGLQDEIRQALQDQAEIKRLQQDLDEKAIKNGDAWKKQQQDLLDLYKKQLDQIREQQRIQKLAQSGLIGVIGDSFDRSLQDGAKSFGDVLTGFGKNLTQDLHDVFAPHGSGTDANGNPTTYHTQQDWKNISDFISNTSAAIQDFAAEWNAYDGGGIPWRAINDAIAKGNIPYASQIAQIVAAFDALVGGKWLGTNYKPDSAARNISFGEEGFSGDTRSTSVRLKAFFGGHEWKTTISALDQETQDQLKQLFQNIGLSMASAARELGTQVPDLVSGSFKESYDANGKLVSSVSTVNGVNYNETVDDFSKRLEAENLIAVLDKVLPHAELQQLADSWRDDANMLLAGANLLLAVQDDIHKGTQVWSATGAGVLTNIVKIVESLQGPGEDLIATYQRLTSAANSYGQLIGGVQQDIDTAGLSDYQKAQLQIEITYRTQVKQANDLAKALGLSGARSEDLAKIEQLRAINMAALQKQLEDQKSNILTDLGLGDLSPLRDDQKLTKAMAALQDAAASGDLNRAQSLAQTTLGLGRNLYASGSDYNSLYNQVTGLVGSIGLAAPGDTNLGDLADILLGLPQQIAAALFDVLYGQYATAATPPPPPPPPVYGGGSGSGSGTGAGGGSGSGSGTGAGGGGGDGGGLQPQAQMVGAIEAVAANTAATLAVSRQLLAEQRSAALRAKNSKVT